MHIIEWTLQMTTNVSSFKFSFQHRIKRTCLIIYMLVIYPFKLTKWFQCLGRNYWLINIAITKWNFGVLKMWKSTQSTFIHNYRKLVLDFYFILFSHGEQPPYLKGETLPPAVLQFANAVSLKLIDRSQFAADKQSTTSLLLVANNYPCCFLCHFTTVWPFDSSTHAEKLTP